jgi:hypothetical protein
VESAGSELVVGSAEGGLASWGSSEHGTSWSRMSGAGADLGASELAGALVGAAVGEAAGSAWPGVLARGEVSSAWWAVPFTDSVSGCLVSGWPVSGRSVSGRSVSGRSVSGRSVSGRSASGRSASSRSESSPSRGSLPSAST